MKNTGIVRRFDELGRIVVPKEIRDSWGIKTNDPIEIYVDEDKIILKQYTSRNTCVITGEVSKDSVRLPSGRTISREGLHILVKEIEDLKTMLK